MAFYSGFYLFASYSSRGYSTEESYSPLPAALAVEDETPLGYYHYSYPVIIEATGTVMVPVVLHINKTPVSPGVTEAVSIQFSVSQADSTTPPIVAQGSKLSLVLSQADSPTPQSISVNAYLSSSPVSSNDVTGGNIITKVIKGDLVPVTQADGVDVRIKVGISSTIVGMSLYDTVSPPIMTVAIASTMIPVTVSSVTDISAVASLTSSSKLSWNTVTENLPSPLGGRYDTTAIPAYTSEGNTVHSVGMSVAIAGTLVSLQSEQVLSASNVTVALLFIPVTANNVDSLEAPGMQFQLKFFSRLMISGDSIVSLDVWRY